MKIFLDFEICYKYEKQNRNNFMKGQIFMDET
jgi:hypothetical protein